VACISVTASGVYVESEQGLTALTGTEIPSKFSPKLDRNEESPQSAPGDVLGSIVPEDPGRATDRQTRVGMISLYRLDDQCL
jgi:hypothetical protein